MIRDHSRGLAVITGTSSGIGAVYADRLAAREYRLLLIARRPDRLRDIAANAEARHGASVTTPAAFVRQALALLQQYAKLA